ncbi:MAG: Amuc_1098 family type IV pilus outer membrane protein [Chthoniobacterales bacterium]
MLRTPAFASLLAAITLSTTLPIFAQSAGLVGAAELETRKREMNTQHAESMIQKGDAAMVAMDYESAFAFFKSAVDSLPSGGEATADVRAEALDGFSRAVVKLAEQRISEGRFEDAEVTVNVILDDNYNPNYGPALSLRAKLRSPDTFNRTITPAFVAKVEEVKQLFREATGYYESARYDLAFKRCEQVLNLDPYNIAARRMMEKINNARNNYAENAYNATRAEMIGQVEAAWELPVTKFDVSGGQIVEQPAIDTRGTQSVSRKLEEIRIPSINFRDATVREAIDFIKQRSVALDTEETDPNRKGINIVLKLDPTLAGADAGTRITLALSDVPLGEALRYIATAANLKVKVEPYAVAIVPTNEQTDVLITKEYKVPPGFVSQIPAPAAPTGGFGGGAGDAATVARSGAREFLESQGITFPPGASANFLAASSKLIVRNTQPNLDLIDQLVDLGSSTVESQVEIEAKFVEISQNNLKELGFDWLLGQFQMPFGTGVYGSGGTTGFSGALPDRDTSIAGTQGYPFVSPTSETPVGTYPITGGNRNGGTAISANAIDGLLLGGTGGAAAAPGVLALAGIFTNPQFQLVIRALDQQKGIDLLSAPRVTTRSGEVARMELIREFRYPTQFDPPQVPQTTASSGSFIPIPPTTPSAFETKNLGVELEVEPTVGPDGYTIELNISPRITEFDGFINYGSPINAEVQYTSALNLLNTVSQTIQVSENVINQPIFSVREARTQVTVYDGETVVLGGLMREDIQKVEDKTPILGDIPLVGRLFHSSADQHIKRNLIMFVTATLLDPAGQRLLQQIENDEIQALPEALSVESEIIPGDPLSAPSF